MKFFLNFLQVNFLHFLTLIYLAINDEDYDINLFAVMKNFIMNIINFSFIKLLPYRNFNFNDFELEVAKNLKLNYELNLTKSKNLDY